MNTLNQRICLHTMGPFVLLLGGAFVVAGWVPPPSPDLAPADTLQVFTVGNLDRIRIAAAMLFFGAALLIPPCAAISAQMRRIEGRGHVLANIQMLSAGAGVLAVQIPAALWLAITYRQDVPAAVVVTLNDICWFFLFGATGPLIVQMVSIALCIFGSDGTIYPRWLAYATLYLAAGEMPGVLIPFFKTGPITWSGIFGFWLVAVAFFAWMILIWTQTAKAINTPAPESRLVDAVH